MASHTNQGRAGRLTPPEGTPRKTLPPINVGVVVASEIQRYIAGMNASARFWARMAKSIPVAALLPLVVYPASTHASTSGANPMAWERGGGQEEPPTIHLGGYRATVKVTSGRLLIRERPAIGSPVVTSAVNKTKIPVFCQTSRFGGRWFMTRSGYASAEYLAVGKQKVQPCSQPSVGSIRIPHRLYAWFDGAPTKHVITASPTNPNAIIAPVGKATDSAFRSTRSLSKKYKQTFPSSVESYYYPGFYLRHQDYQVKLQTPFKVTSREISLFRMDAAFEAWGTFDRQENFLGLRFESYNYPGRNIRHYRGTVEVTSEGDRPATPYYWDSRWRPKTLAGRLIPWPEPEPRP